MPTLNGYYEDDFKEKQATIRKILESEIINWGELNKLMDGELIKFCGCGKSGKVFYYNWAIVLDDKT